MKKTNADDYDDGDGDATDDVVDEELAEEADSSIWG